ncbi:MAG: protein-export chaperone SecB [Oscillospiraceae bacterium]|nr:protein-export chaperone SecB [Oscillospiraceae bacterium]
MATAQLTQQRVNEYHFTNKINQPGQIKMNTTFSFNVNFVQNNSRCVAVIRQVIRDENDQINLKVGMSGVFNCEGVVTDEDKKSIHAQCYDQMFPYIQSTVTSLMQVAGIPGFMLRKATINSDNVQLAAANTNAAPKKQFPIV